MALKTSPLVVEALEQLRDGGYFRRLNRIKVKTIQSLAEGWLDISLEVADIRATLSAAGVSTDDRRDSCYSVQALIRSLEEDGSLKKLASRNHEAAEKALERVRQSESQGPRLRRTPARLPGFDPSGEDPGQLGAPEDKQPQVETAA